MKKPLIIILVFGSALLIGGILAADSYESETDNSAIADNTSSQIQDNDDLATPGIYKSVSAAEIDNFTDSKRVLFFHASWCPTCLALDRDIKASENKIPTNISILKLNIDEELELKRKYGVTLQHTLVQIDEDGNELGQWNGSPSLVSLLDKVR
jgi:thiol-disulfide isomerase/thioredoxin